MEEAEAKVQAVPFHLELVTLVTEFRVAIGNEFLRLPCNRNRIPHHLRRQVDLNMKTIEHPPSPQLVDVRMKKTIQPLQPMNWRKSVPDFGWIQRLFVALLLLSPV